MTIGQRLAELIEWHIAGRPDPEPTALQECDNDEREQLLAALDGFINTAEERTWEYVRSLAEY